MGTTWVLWAPGGPHIGPMNLAIGDVILWALLHYIFSVVSLTCKVYQGTVAWHTGCIQQGRWQLPQMTISIINVSWTDSILIWNRLCSYKYLIYMTTSSTISFHVSSQQLSPFTTLRPTQNIYHIPYEILKFILLHESCCILMHIQ